MSSIKSRLTMVSMIVLIVFMILTAFALERAVWQRTLQAEQDRLQVLIYSLLGAVDRNRMGLSITVSTDRLFDASLMTPDSGLYAMIYNSERETIWHSRSMTVEFPDIEQIKPGDWQFSNLEYQSAGYFRLAFAIQWPDVNNKLRRYDVVVWQNASEYFLQLDRFRQTLWAWLLATIVLLVIIIYLLSMWSLRPLQRVGQEVKAIEDKKQTGFEHSYPVEIMPLTENLNILLAREQYQQQRYRNAMDDLAHSLKTPLAVLAGLSGRHSFSADEMKTLQEQVDRMNQIVSYQLQRASSVVGAKINKPVDLVEIIERVTSALEKVYLEKNISLDMDLAAEVQLRMDESDCLEVIGNLLDNAFKFALSKVKISVIELGNGEMQLIIEDDGTGLKPQEIDQILRRGARLDQAREGQGIGLAVVSDIVESYNIALSFGRSNLGGLKLKLQFQKV